MAPENPGRQAKVGDVASLLGRIIRTGFVLLVAFAVLASGPLMAAPFAAIVMDARNGEILYEKNANTRLHPASLTKMMTLYIVFQEIEAGNISLDTMVTVSDNAASQPPSRLGLKPGQKISVRHLVRAAAIKSANDAASALGDAISGDHKAFAKRMTATARELGMYDTTFKNANGLTAEGHLSTAHDMNVLGRHLFYDFPDYYSLFSRRTADAGVATVTNTNSRFLDSYEGADGIKTGFTEPAGYNLTASARRGDEHIIATIFGGTSSANRNAKMGELMDLGFEKAGSNVKEVPPSAAPIVGDDLIAAVEAGIDEIGAEGGAGKTIRVSGEVTKSPRPRPRPDLPSVPDDVAIAMAAGIDGALEEATAAPAPEGTLDFQAEAIATTETSETPVPPVVAPTPEVEVALADAVAAEPVPPVAEVEPALTEEQPVELTLAEVEPAPDAPELVVTDPGPEVSRSEDPALMIANVSEIETVAGATSAAPEPVEFAAATVTVPEVKRAAPIFDSVTVAETVEEPVQEEVVVVMSTSGGRHFGVNVGEYPSQYEAERALLKTALAESATLDGGLRKTTQSGGVWRATFMGLSEDQAALACRRLSARAIPCETVGG